MRQWDPQFKTGPNYTSGDPDTSEKKEERGNRQKEEEMDEEECEKAGDPAQD